MYLGLHVFWGRGAPQQFNSCAAGFLFTWKPPEMREERSAFSLLGDPGMEVVTSEARALTPVVLPRSGSRSSIREDSVADGFATSSTAARRADPRTKRESPEGCAMRQGCTSW